MKTLMSLFFVLAISTSVHAAEQWMCTGWGTINMGGPGGVITVPVQGTGSTQQDAWSNANQNCRSQGLQMCMVNNCFKR